MVPRIVKDLRHFPIEIAAGEADIFLVLHSSSSWWCRGSAPHVDGMFAVMQNPVKQYD